MNLPISWLKEYVDLNVDLKEYVDKMTMLGQKVENVTLVSHDITNVVVGKITKIEKHPDADKLVVCQVDVGEKTVQIVTGAPNVFEGAIVPVALNGAVLHGGLKIKSSKLRGVLSDGMMCSVEELGFTQNDYPEAPEDGIYIFKEDPGLGKNVLEVLDMIDEVVEFELTSNRVDCFSILGLARESSVCLNKPFKYPKVTLKEEAGEDANTHIKIDIENPELCQRYVARVVKNVKIGPSPLWLRHRLTMSGIRPINNMVDITNYVMLEYGQPMHAFDIDFVKNRHIIVRNAKDDENFTTLDGVERKLNSSMLVIADEEKALAIAGIMGGENSKITENASAVLLESACFDGTNVRVSSKKLGLRTDSSAKFEKGLDPNLASEAIDRAAQLIEMLGCGQIVKGQADCYVNKREPITIKYSPEKINALLGTDISAEDMESFLNKLEIETKDNIAYIKTFRPDLIEEADLAEEIARVYGYDKIKPTLYAGTPTIGKKSEKQIIEDKTKDILVSCGLSETMVYSFESPKVFDKLLVPENDKLRQVIKILNPLGEDYSVMRTTTINGMLNNLSNNYNKRNMSAELFELAAIYVSDEIPLKKLPEERKTLTLGMYGEKDFYDLKGIVEELFTRLGLELDKIDFSGTGEISFMHPGRTADISYEDTSLGFMGEVHPVVLNNYGLDVKVYAAILDFEKIVESSNLKRTFKSLPKFPEVKRDLAMVVDDSVLIKDITHVMKKSGGKLVSNIALFDIYKGPQIGDGLKSVAFNITYVAEDRTLKDEEVNNSINKIIKNLENELNAKLR